MQLLHTTLTTSTGITFPVEIEIKTEDCQPGAIAVCGDTEVRGWINADHRFECGGLHAKRLLGFIGEKGVPLNRVSIELTNQDDYLNAKKRYYAELSSFTPQRYRIFMTVGCDKRLTIVDDSGKFDGEPANRSAVRNTLCRYFANSKVFNLRAFDVALNHPNPNDYTAELSAQDLTEIVHQGELITEAHEAGRVARLAEQANRRASSFAKAARTGQRQPIHKGAGYEQHEGFQVAVYTTLWALPNGATETTETRIELS